MKIKFVEIQNFRRLRSTHIDFDDETTIFVGSNNSGKTSAMVALRFFLLDTNKLTFRDITLSNWPKLDQLGTVWEKAKEGYEPVLDELVSLMPTMDFWFDVADDELHHVIDLIPTLEWKGGLLGLRLRYEPKELTRFYQEFLSAKKAANEMSAFASKRSDEEKALKLWPESMLHFMERRFSALFRVRAYVLNPEKLKPPVGGEAIPQALTESQAALDSDPLVNLIRIDEIAAQRELADAGGSAAHEKDDNPDRPTSRRLKRKLSEQLRSYYNRHLSPDRAPDVSDLGALSAIQKAERAFDEKLEAGFRNAIDELQSLGYPGLADPRLKIKTQLQATDGLRHRSAVQYELAASSSTQHTPLMLPEDYSGLGYQNLISMVFMLMSFRDDWMRVGKAAVSMEPYDIQEKTPPLHLVLVEEPEAHLHAQVQQVFIKKAYALLRKHEHLGDSKALSTQLIVSTHSSHLAHEADFKCLRYFRRRPAIAPAETPVTTVANLSDVFGEGDGTQRFVSRYLKATHCDLFFADAAILVEGQAERILVPHFIRYHFDRLSRRYVSLLEIGGSHAHKFRPLIEKLGLITLIFSDLDSVLEKEVNQKKRWHSVRPAIGENQKSRNPVLTSWHPAKDLIDDLVKLSPEDRTIHPDPHYSIHVSYQQTITLAAKEGQEQSIIPRTFEDALVLANQAVFEKLNGARTTEKIKALINEYQGEELADELFSLLKTAEKAAFALDVLMHEKPSEVMPPQYIANGLTWLDEELVRKGSETVNIQGK